MVYKVYGQEVFLLFAWDRKGLVQRVMCLRQKSLRLVYAGLLVCALSATSCRCQDLLLFCWGTVVSFL